MAPVELRVNGLSGQLCLLTVEYDWSLAAVKEAIADATRIPASLQLLIAGTMKLQRSDASLTLKDLATSESDNCMELTLLRVAPNEDALRRAIVQSDSAAAVDLLRMVAVPGLNEVPRSSGRSLLHHAARLGLSDVCLALIYHEDFKLISNKELIHLR